MGGPKDPNDCKPRDTRVDRSTSLRRTAVLLLVSIAVAAEMVLTEALFVGHIVFLVHTLGFAGGFAVFTAIWAALGLAVLAVADFAWPRMVPRLSHLLERFSRRSSDTQGSTSTRALLAALGVTGVLAAAGVAIAIVGSEIKDWTIGHPADVGRLVVAALVISTILLAIARLGRGLANWARSTADRADPVTRSLGALVSMMFLGPALGWLLFRLLRYSRRSIYALTLVAAPVFGVVWVPFYGLGVWSLVKGLF